MLTRGWGCRIFIVAVLLLRCWGCCLLPCECRAASWGVCPARVPARPGPAFNRTRATGYRFHDPAPGGALDPWPATAAVRVSVVAGDPGTTCAPGVHGSRRHFPVEINLLGLY